LITTVSDVGFPGQLGDRHAVVARPGRAVGATSTVPFAERQAIESRAELYGHLPKHETDFPFGEQVPGELVGLVLVPRRACTPEVELRGGERVAVGPLARQVGHPGRHDGWQIVGAALCWRRHHSVFRQAAEIAAV
jgi:hypothetical protein